MKRFLLGLAGLLSLLIGVFTGLAHTPQSPRELVFLNGEIRTTSGPGIVEAMHVRDGRIVALGSRDEVLAHAPWLTARVDLDGGTMTPGLIEPHTHPLASALLSTTIDISGTRYETRDEIIAAIAEGVAHPGPSPWTVAFGWDPVMLDGLSPPSLEELNALSPDRPLVILTQMMHEAFANSAALQAAGITRETPDPHDGYFERDEAGALTGRLVEVNAVRALMDAIPGASDAALTWLLAAEYDRYARAGYTTIGVASLVGRADDPLGVLHAVAGGETPSLNTVLYTAPEDAERGRTLFQNVDPVPAIRRFAGIKMWVDGSPFTGGAATAEPYEDTDFNQTILHLESGWVAPLSMPEDEIRALTLAAHQRGEQVAFHAQGERAVQVALDAIAQARAQAPGQTPMHRMEHLALITPEQIDLANNLQVSLGFFPDHIGNYGHRLTDMFGPDRARRYMPIAQAVERDSAVTIHGDHPASAIDAMRVMALPVHRMTRSDEALGRAIDAQTSLILMSRHAARQLELDDEIGTLEIGKRADLTWFDRDPVAAIEAGERAEVIGTWVSGRRIDTRPWSLRHLRLALAALWGQITLSTPNETED
ncbi:MAG: amidohydrolase [Alphaproteobacteria bacterium]|uniref:amidohydrolase n=1 Tax=Maricaulis alexandrii TaxID=2570354 RepID=UPI0011083B81|nr:amidohydrolase [Maricaulis alexandrii]MCR9267410.1 amidohydrolase [Alphaproteobacteria bacterium]